MSLTLHLTTAYVQQILAKALGRKDKLTMRWSKWPK